MLGFLPEHLTRGYRASLLPHWRTLPRGTTLGARPKDAIDTQGLQCSSFLGSIL